MADRTEHRVVAAQELTALVQGAAAKQLPYDTPAEIEPVVEEIVEMLRPLVTSPFDLDRLSRVLPDLLRKVSCWSDETPYGYVHDYDTKALRACVLGCDTVSALAARLKRGIPAATSTPVWLDGPDRDR
ncbi:MAG: hypothetical protein MUF10_00980 [Thermoanaerobaculaceae bacterium]|jgi:hypothetical protein|nr:hypothetical protein [Thermoanaerobaculaceae bacterium]